MEKMLIATDFDGTLYRGGEIDDGTRRAIDRWRAAGRLFGVVTGRGRDFYDTALSLGLPFDYLIVCTGCLLLAPDGRVLREFLIPPETFAALEAALSAFADLTYCSKSDGLPRHHLYATFPSAGRALEVRQALLPAFGDRVSIHVNGPHINIGAAGTGKTEGVGLILRHFALPADAAAVVGDDYNDLDMLLAYHGWAVTSGQPDVVRRAPHRCESVGSLISALLETP